jgi:hypothetical protein
MDGILPQATIDKLKDKAVRREAATQRHRENTKRWISEKKEETNETCHDFWKKNRAALSEKTLQGMLAQHERVHDLLDWMELCGYENEGLDFVSVEKTTADVVEFVQQHSVVRLGYVLKNDIPPDWSSQTFWLDDELMVKLLAESKQMAQYVRYGLFASLPDWQVVKFLTNRAGWSWDKAAAFVGYPEERKRK